MVVRLLAGFGGVILLGAMTHSSVLKAGGYASADAVNLIAIAVGLFAASVVFGANLHSKSVSLKIALFVCLLGAELVAGYRTLKETLAASAAASEPARLVAVKWKEASEERDRAKAKVDAADAAIAKSATEKLCASNCVALLQTAKKDADKELLTASKVLAGLDRPKAVLTVAEALRVDPINLELAVAVGSALALNGLGACLLALAAHGGRRAASLDHQMRPRADNDAVPVERQEPTPLVQRVDVRQVMGVGRVPSSVLSGEVHNAQAVQVTEVRSHPTALVDGGRSVDDFGVECLMPGRGVVTVEQVRQAYLDWCRVRSVPPADAERFGEVLGLMVREAGLTVTCTKGVYAIRGVKIVPPSLLAIAQAS
jgi:predicted nucleic acid-binding protein